MFRNIILSMILFLTSFTLLSCTPTVSQEDYDRVKAELSKSQNQIAVVQSELVETETIKAEYDELLDDYNTALSKLETMQAEYDELEAKYDDLKAKYNELGEQYEVLIEGTPISEEAVELAVFDLINQERVWNDLVELEWSSALYSWAKSHSRHMATEKSLEYIVSPLWQGVWQATGYRSVDRLANATLLIWKDSSRFEQHFLGKGAKYGAVAVHKSGEIFYITYIAIVDI